MELMTAIFAICGGVVNTVMGSVGGSISTAATLPTEIVTAVESLGLLETALEDIAALTAEVGE